MAIFDFLWQSYIRVITISQGEFQMRKVLINLAIITLVFSIHDEVYSGGYMVPHQTARGLGLANAVTAGVNDPSAVYHNPAALSEVDGNMVLGSGTYLSVINSVENSGRTARNKHDDNWLAALFGNYHIPGSDLTFGIGTYTPFGLATTYEQEFTRFASERAELRTIYVTPAVSWHPSSYFSLGAGLSFIHASGLFSRGLCFDPGPGCPVEGRLRVTDTANAFTYNLGILVKPLQEIKIGISYRARADIRFDSADVKFNGPITPTKTRAVVRPLPLPPVLNLGLFWQITPPWGIEVVYEYARWKEFKRFAASFSPIPTLFGVVPLSGFSLPQDWKNTSTIRLGSFYKVSQDWELRGGMGLEETPIPSHTLNPSIPGSDILTLNTGIGYKWRQFSFDVGYMAAFYKNRTVINNELEGVNATGIPFSGAPGSDKYRTFNHQVTASFGYRF